MKLHLAETYHSLKGEGLWSGCPMFFIRFAGCNVGKKDSKDMEVRESNTDDVLKVVKGTTCTSWDGRQFGCDTDYNSHLSVELTSAPAIEAFFDQIWEKRVVLTGGEPMMSLGTFQWLVYELLDRGKIPHIETSGTIEWKIPEQCWVAVAPKFGCHDSMIYRANEVKLLVDENFNLGKIPQAVFSHNLVFLMPINSGREHNQANLELCNELVQANQDWRVGIQMHKYLNIR